MTRNGLRLLDMDENRRELLENRFSDAIQEACRRGCEIDCATSDVCVYLIGAKSMEDTEAIGKLIPGYIPGLPFFDMDTLEQVEE